MIRYITLCVFLLGVGVIAVSLSGGSQSENTPISPAAKSVDQTPPTGTAKEPGKTQESKAPEGKITDADRIIRLESSIGADEKQLAELETELKKAHADEETDSADVQQSYAISREKYISFQTGKSPR